MPWAAIAPARSDRGDPQIRCQPREIVGITREDDRIRLAGKQDNARVDHIDSPGPSADETGGFGPLTRESVDRRLLRGDEPRQECLAARVSPHLGERASGYMNLVRQFENPHQPPVAALDCDERTGVEHYMSRT